VEDHLTELDIKLLIEIARKYQITYLAIFGSYARGEAGPESDVDLAVRFAGHYSMFDLTGAMADMAEALGKKVDLIPLDDAYAFVRQSIEREMVVLYETEERVYAQTR
jgi:uncharacterized protein